MMEAVSTSEICELMVHGILFPQKHGSTYIIPNCDIVFPKMCSMHGGIQQNVDGKGIELILKQIINSIYLSFVTNI